MMTFRNFGDYLGAEPFRPFRIKLASGSTYEIRHPEMILVGRTSARVYTIPPGDSGNGALARCFAHAYRSPRTN